VDLLRLLIAGTIAVAPNTALSQSNLTADAAVVCCDDLRHPEASPADHARSSNAATIGPTSLPSARYTAGAAEATPAPPPSDDVPPLLRAIQQSDEERRRQEFERAGGALFPPRRATDRAGKTPAAETATGPSAAVPPAVASQIDPAPNALFVPLAPQRSAR
jgi:hypothetical protein